MFIELTPAMGMGIIMVNIEMIRDVSPSTDGNSIFTYANGESREVKETYTQIRERMEAAWESRYRRA